MHFKYGALLSTAFSAAILVGQGISTPANAHILEKPSEIVSPVKEAFSAPHLQECMLERRRLLYEARSNTLIMTNIAMSAHQEIPMGPKLQ